MSPPGWPEYNTLTGNQGGSCGPSESRRTHNNLATLVLPLAFPSARLWLRERSPAHTPMATLFHFVSPQWDDTADELDLPAVFADLLAAAQPFIITAIEHPNPQEADDFDDYTAQCLTPYDRNPCLCLS
jgi:hypothetical protein